MVGDQHMSGKKNDMKIHLYALCWNEEKMLPYFLRHYESLVDKIFIYDNQSTDNSREILKKHPKVILNEFTIKTDSFVLEALDFYNNIWKNSRGVADWVILCNIDEHFYHPHWHDYLQACLRSKITIVNSKGYGMVSDTFPTSDTLLYQQIRYGVHHKNNDKIACFNPNAITEINFGPGRHGAKPKGKVVYTKKRAITLLHYKMLSVDYVVARFAELGERMKSIDRKRGLGCHYSMSRAEIEQQFSNMIASAVEPLAGEPLVVEPLVVEPLSGTSLFLQKLRRFFYAKPKND